VQPSFLPFGVLVVGTSVCCAPVLRVPPASPGRASSARSPTPHAPTTTCPFHRQHGPASRSSALSGEPRIGYCSLKASAAAPDPRGSQSFWRRRVGDRAPRREAGDDTRTLLSENDRSRYTRPCGRGGQCFRDARCNATRVTRQCLDLPRSRYTPRMRIGVRARVDARSAPRSSA
jgi:hypothetical protein